MKAPYHIILILLLGIALSRPDRASAQSANDIRIDLRADRKSLKEIFTQIQQKSGLLFVYNDKLVSAYTNISLKADSRTIASILTELLSRTNLLYIEQNRKIIIAEKELVASAAGIPKPREAFLLGGRVLNQKGEPILGATVFLSNTRHSTSSDGSGKFNLGQFKSEKYEIVVKMLGYDTYTQEVYIQNSPVDLAITIIESSIPLNPVVIQGGPANPMREEYLELFKEYFIGESLNATFTEILNPEVLNLQYNKRKNILEARSDQFLIIDNYSLGYRIHYLISQFELDLRSNILTYKGAPYFTEMEGPADLAEKWELNRRAAYKGSVKHFFRTLFTQSTAAEGFLIYPVPKKQIIKKLTRTLDERELMKIRPVRIDSIFSLLSEDYIEMRYTATGDGSAAKSNTSKKDTNPYYIVYTKEREPMEFIVSGRHITFPINKKLSAESQISTIEPLVNNILIRKNGEFPPESILFKGYWSWEAISDLLPADYVDRQEAAESEK